MPQLAHISFVKKGFVTSFIEIKKIDAIFIRIIEISLKFIKEN